tara:strand:+ start:289 stop:498 length:210 start_codon:yes stop_codon:yes gene_type:complete
MVFTAYVCDDFELRDSGVLVIYGNYAEFTSNDSEMVQKFIDNGFYNAVVCPALYKNEFGARPKKIKFAD